MTKFVRNEQFDLMHWLPLYRVPRFMEHKPNDMKSFSISTVAVMDIVTCSMGVVLSWTHPPTPTPIRGGGDSMASPSLCFMQCRSLSSYSVCAESGIDKDTAGRFRQNSLSRLYLFRFRVGLASSR